MNLVQIVMKNFNTSSILSIFNILEFLVQNKLFWFEFISTHYVFDKKLQTYCKL